jgi:hypothetical protein
VATVLARAAGWDEHHVAASARDLWVKAATTRPVGRPVAELTNIDALKQLGVHSAIEVAGATNLPPLHPYLKRDFDHELWERVGEAVAGESILVVLVGGPRQARPGPAGKRSKMTSSCHHSGCCGTPGLTPRAARRSWRG